MRVGRERDDSTGGSRAGWHALTLAPSNKHAGQGHAHDDGCTAKPEPRSPYQKRKHQQQASASGSPCQSTAVHTKQQREHVGEWQPGQEARALLKLQHNSEAQNTERQKG